MEKKGKKRRYKELANVSVSAGEKRLSFFGRAASAVKSNFLLAACYLVSALEILMKARVVVPCVYQPVAERVSAGQVQPFSNTDNCCAVLRCKHPPTGRRNVAASAGRLSRDPEQQNTKRCCLIEFCRPEEFTSRSSIFPKSASGRCQQCVQAAANRGLNVPSSMNLWRRTVKNEPDEAAFVCSKELRKKTSGSVEHCLVYSAAKFFFLQI